MTTSERNRLESELASPSRAHSSPRKRTTSSHFSLMQGICSGHSGHAPPRAMWKKCTPENPASLIASKSQRSPSFLTFPPMNSNQTSGPRNSPASAIPTETESHSAATANIILRIIVSSPTSPSRQGGRQSAPWSGDGSYLTRKRPRT